jgi:hypothetical protein
MAQFGWKIEEDEKSLQCHISNCMWCKDKEDQVALIFFIMGIFQEFLAWVSGGKVYPIQSCRANQGDVWQILISKQYIT